MWTTAAPAATSVLAMTAIPRFAQMASATQPRSPASTTITCAPLSPAMRHGAVASVIHGDATPVSPAARRQLDASIFAVTRQTVANAGAAAELETIASEAGASAPNRLFAPRQIPTAQVNQAEIVNALAPRRATGSAAIISPVPIRLPARPARRAKRNSAQASSVRLKPLAAAAEAFASRRADSHSQRLAPLRAEDQQMPDSNP